MIKDDSSLLALLKPIKGVIFDVDGILTDCRLWMADDGTWRRAFNVRDGLGIKSLLKAGYIVGWITGSKSPDIQARAKMLGVNFIRDGQDSKEEAFREFLTKYSLDTHEVAAMGDDLPDLAILNQCGFSVTVPEAVDEVLSVCNWVTRKSGGQGAVRELCDQILKLGALRS